MRVMCSALAVLLCGPVLAAGPARGGAPVGAKEQAAAVENPFAPLPPSAPPVERLIRCAQFGQPGADVALRDRLEGDASVSAALKRAGWTQLCKDYTVTTQYRAAASACAEADANGGNGGSGIPAALLDEPAITTSGSARTPLVWNSIGTEDTDVTVNSVTAPWMVDTGAEISVIAQSDAARMGVRIVNGLFQVGTTTTPVNGQIGVIDRIQIGAAVAANVPVLVLPDAQLTVGGRARIQGILGLQVIRAFHRVAWTGDGAYLELGPSALKIVRGGHRLYWHGSGLGIALGTKVANMGALLDTGSNKTFLWAHGLDLLTSAQKAQAVQQTSETGGAGGVVTVQQSLYPRLTFEIAGVPVVLTDVALATDGTQGAGRVGMNAVARLEALILDFDHMTIAATPSRAPIRTH